jgi:hypothetical protein
MRFIPSKLNLIIGIGPGDGVGVLVKVTEVVDVAVPLAVKDDEGDDPTDSDEVGEAVIEVVTDGVGVDSELGVCEGVAEIGIPRIIMLSADRAADGVPTTTATTRQHTFGLLFAVKGIAGERIAVIHVPVGVVGVVTPKGVNAPKDPVVL